MDWKQKRLNDLNTRLLNKTELLGEYEKKFDYEREPSEKRRIQDIIQKLKEDISAINFEFEGFSKSTNKELDENTPETELNIVKTRQQYYDEYIERKHKEKN